MYELWQALFKRTFRTLIADTDASALPDAPCILVSNHIDWLDGLLLSVLAYRRTKRKTAFLARTNNWRIFGQAHILVHQDRERILREMEARLARGEHVGVFIEGYRNAAQELAKGKRGAARFAVRSGAPVVPVGIQGRSWPNTLSSIRHAFTDPPRFRFGAPRDYAAYRGRAVNDQTLDAITEELMREISALSGKFYPYTPNS
jgi:1-acyl-sn-glycerol-3-phosphate acyltransferase